MNTRLIRMMLAILALALVTLACGLGAGEPAPEEVVPTETAESIPVELAETSTAVPTKEPQPTATTEPTSTPEPTATPEIILGDEYESEAGGFVFRSIPGYELEEDGGFVILMAPDGDQNTGPGIALVWENPDQNTTLGNFFDEQVQSLTFQDIQISEPYEVIIDGIAGRAADITGIYDDIEINAQFSAVLVQPGQGFIMLAISPAEQWVQFSPLVQAVEDSIWFSIPQASDPPEIADLSLEEEYRSEKGGYLFNQIPDYSLEETDGYTMLMAPDAVPKIGPSIFLMGGMRGESLTLDELYNEQVQNFNPGDNVILSPYRDVTVGGLPGRSVDLTGTTNEGLDMTGRVTVVLVNPNQMFLMGGISSPERWEEVSGIYEALQSSITFFDAAANTGSPPAVEPKGEEIRQWAKYAYASSSYDDPDWSASQAKGAPDVLVEACTDSPLAWASYDSDTVEWLELVYETPVIPTEINIIQNHSPDQVVKVELIDQAGLYQEVYTGVPVDHWMECPYTLSIPVNVDYAVAGLKITIDQSVIASPWNEIDAVELVGFELK